MPPAVLRLRYEGASASPAVSATNALPGAANYLIGNDPAAWRTNLPTYEGIVYEGLYAGIDVRYEGSDGQLKSTYFVAPGADPAAIRWDYEGATGVRVDESSGDLLITVPGAGCQAPSEECETTLIERAPVAWQEIEGQRVAVTVAFGVSAEGVVSFVLGAYDAAQPLVIDPTLEYSTYLSGSGIDDAFAVAVNSNGEAHVTGLTWSSDFPVTNTLPTGGTKAAAQDAFVLKLNATGTALLYSTFLGGSRYDHGLAIAVDGSNRALVAGGTHSSNFPTANAFDSALSGASDGFVTRLDSRLRSLLYSTYVGGSKKDWLLGLAQDSSGYTYVVGSSESSDFYTTTTAIQTQKGGNDCGDPPCADIVIARAWTRARWAAPRCSGAATWGAIRSTTATGSRCGGPPSTSWVPASR